MKFCPHCENMLMPKDKKLYCKVCEVYFQVNKEDSNDFKLGKKIDHKEEDATPLISKEGFNSEKITGQDRKAFEEFFGIEDMEG